MHKHHYNKTKAAAEIGLSRYALSRRLKGVDLTAVTALEQPECNFLESVVNSKLKMAVTNERQAKAELSELQLEYQQLKQVDSEFSRALREVATREVPVWRAGVRLEGDRTPVVPGAILSDIHYGEVIRSEECGGSNSYNTRIAAERVKEFFEACVTITKVDMAGLNPDGFLLVLGGDMLSGEEHDELTESNEQALYRATLDVVELIRPGISLLAREFGKVTVPCVPGNHARRHIKPRMKSAAVNTLDWMVYTLLAKSFEDHPGVTFQVSESRDLMVDVLGWKYLLTHGDRASGGAGLTGIVPALARYSLKKQAQYSSMGKPFDHLLMGHFHQLTVLGDLVVNGSVKGYDEYAYNMGLRCEPPRQLYFVTHPTRGLCYMTQIAL